MRYTSRQGSAEGIFRQSLQLPGRLSIEGRRCMASAGHIAVEGCSIILSLPFVVIHVVGCPGNNRRQTSRYHVKDFMPHLAERATTSCSREWLGIPWRAHSATAGILCSNPKSHLNQPTSQIHRQTTAKMENDKGELVDLCVALNLRATQIGSVKFSRS